VERMGLMLGVIGGIVGINLSMKRAISRHILTNQLIVKDLNTRDNLLLLAK